jgi:hypothetical protein
MDKIAIVGGTGQEGFGLALRWAQAGESVIIGSRESSKASSSAAEVKKMLPDAFVEGLANAEAVAQAKVVVLTVPLLAQITTLKSIRDRLQPGTVFIDATVPLEKALGGRLSRVIQLWDGSAAEQVARYVGKQVRVAGAFHSLSAEALRDLERPVDTDVLITGDSREARATVSALVGKISGARPLDLGPLENSRYAEQLAALLITLNLRHRVSASGIRFTGLPDARDS